MSGFRHLSGTTYHFPHAQGLSKPGILRIEPGCGWHLTVSLQAIPASHRRPLQSRFDVVPCGFGRNSEACGFHLDSSIFVIHVHTFFRFAGETTPNCDSKVEEPAAAAAHLLIILIPVQNGLNMTNTHAHTHTCRKYLIT